MGADSSVINRPFSERLSAFITFMAFLMGAVSAACFMAIAYYIFKSPLDTTDLEGDLIKWLVSNFHTPIILLLSALFAGLFGVFFLRLAKSSLAHIIPPADRELLGDLISKEKAEGINLYIRLSRLRGLSGTFSHLGITGLPLATIGLTLVFAILSIWTSNENVPNGAFLDLAKLTLGAFIGSFVQRQIAPDISKSEADKILANQRNAVERRAAARAEAERAEALRKEEARIVSQTPKTKITAALKAEAKRAAAKKADAAKRSEEAAEAKSPKTAAAETKGIAAEEKKGDGLPPEKIDVDRAGGEEEPDPGKQSS